MNSSIQRTKTSFPSCLKASRDQFEDILPSFNSWIVFSVAGMLMSTSCFKIHEIVHYFHSLGISCISSGLGILVGVDVNWQLIGPILACQLIGPVLACQQCRTDQVIIDHVWDSSCLEGKKFSILACCKMTDYWQATSIPIFWHWLYCFSAHKPARQERVTVRLQVESNWCASDQYRITLLWHEWYGDQRIKIWCVLSLVKNSIPVSAFSEYLILPTPSPYQKIAENPKTSSAVESESLFLIVALLGDACGRNENDQLRNGWSLFKSLNLSREVVCTHVV